MEDMRKKLIGIVSVVLIVLVSILLIAMLADDSNTATPPKAEETAPQAQDKNRIIAPEQQPIPLPPEPVSTEDAGERYARQSATIVVERLGSYSNQNDNIHIEDLQSVVTKSMYSYMEANLLQDQGNEYSGVSTKVITSKIVSYSTSAAEVEVGVQRKVSSAQGSNMEYKTGNVKMVKQGNTWLVDGIFWQE